MCVVLYWIHKHITHYVNADHLPYDKRSSTKATLASGLQNKSRTFVFDVFIHMNYWYSMLKSNIYTVHLLKSCTDLWYLFVTSVLLFSVSFYFSAFEMQILYFLLQCIYFKRKNQTQIYSMLRAAEDGVNLPRCECCSQYSQHIESLQT